MLGRYAPYNKFHTYEIKEFGGERQKTRWQEENCKYLISAVNGAYIIMVSLEISVHEAGLKAVKEVETGLLRLLASLLDC